MQKKEWYNFINDQLNEKFTLIEEIDKELLNLQNMNYDFAASGKIEGESIRIQVDDENFDDDIVIDRKEVYLQCVSNYSYQPSIFGGWYFLRFFKEKGTNYEYI